MKSFLILGPASILLCGLTFASGQSSDCVSTIPNCAECLSSEACMKCNSDLYITEDGSSCLASCDEYRISLAGDVQGRICEDDDATIVLLNWQWTLIAIACILLLALAILTTMVYIRRRKLKRLTSREEDDPRKSLTNERGFELHHMENGAGVGSRDEGVETGETELTTGNTKGSSTGRYSQAEINSVLKYKKDKFVNRIHTLKPEKHIFLIILNLVKRSQTTNTEGDNEEQESKEDQKQIIILDLTILLLILNDSLSQIRLSVGNCILKWGEQVLNDYKEQIDRGVNEEDLVLPSSGSKAQSDGRRGSPGVEVNVGSEVETEDGRRSSSEGGDPIVILHTNTKLPRYSSVMGGDMPQGVEGLITNLTGGTGGGSIRHSLEIRMGESSTDDVQEEEEEERKKRGVRFDDDTRREGMADGAEDVYIPREDYESAAEKGEPARVTSVEITVTGAEESETPTASAAASGSGGVGNARDTAPDTTDVSSAEVTASVENTTSNGDTLGVNVDSNDDAASVNETPTGNEEIMVWYL